MTTLKITRVVTQFTITFRDICYRSFIFYTRHKSPWMLIDPLVLCVSLKTSCDILRPDLTHQVYYTWCPHVSLPASHPRCRGHSWPRLCCNKWNVRTDQKEPEKTLTLWDHTEKLYQVCKRRNVRRHYRKYSAVESRWSRNNRTHPPCFGVTIRLWQYPWTKFGTLQSAFRSKSHPVYNTFSCSSNSLINFRFGQCRSYSKLTPVKGQTQSLPDYQMRVGEWKPRGHEFMKRLLYRVSAFLEQVTSSLKNKGLGDGWEYPVRKLFSDIWTF